MDVPDGLHLLVEAWGEVSRADGHHLPHPLTVGLEAGFADIQIKGLLVLAPSEMLMKAVASFPIYSTPCIPFGASQASKAFLQGLDNEVRDHSSRGSSAPETGLSGPACTYGIQSPDCHHTLPWSTQWPKLTQSTMFHTEVPARQY